MSRERWDAFLTKVAARADEICAEADPGFDALIETEVLDPAPLSSALSEFHARMMGLEKKIDEQWEKLGLDDDALQAAGRKLQKEIEQKSRVLQVKKQSRAAHALYALAEKEMGAMREKSRCSSCGAPIAPTVLHEASNVSCNHCKSVSVVRPGVATAMFFQGIGLHALGEEAALGLRDTKTLEYWLTYARGYGAKVPGWSEARSRQMAEAKLKGATWSLSPQ